MTTRLIKRSERLARIEQMLFQNAVGLRAVQIADACGVDRRTVYRDLALLNKSGIPVYQKDGRFFIKHEYYLAKVRLNANEAIALYIAARMVAYHAEQQNPFIVSALTKLSAALPESLASHVAFTTQAAMSIPIDRGFMTVLETITRAWGERRKVKLWYKASKNQEMVAREFSTYFIEPTASGSVYAVGLDDFSGRVRALKIERLKRVKLLQSNYDIPSRFDPRRYLAAGWGVIEGNIEDKENVVLLFSADAAPLIRERAFNNAEEITLLRDERCILRIQVADWHDLLGWVRSWGTQVEVLEPQALCDEIVNEAKRVLALYGAKSKA